jgi:ubiquinone/menaquinone biosynthesis C-methylase UbiE
MPVTKIAFSLCAGVLIGWNEPVLAQRPTSEPYKGDLAIFENADRAQKLQIDRVMDLLGIKRGSQVADIGAGSGWFTVRGARRVGSEGLVYAVEINPEYVRHIQRRAKREKLSNIRTILGKPDDPTLPQASIEVAFLLKTYHEIARPIAFLRRLRAGLRPGATLGIIDKNGKGDDHGLNADVVIKEAAQAGFTLIAQHDFVKGDKMDYFLIFNVR